jgi:acetyltransferase-like isoleucine patch superfamily enzyme
MQLTDSRLIVRLFNWWQGSRIIRSGPDHRVQGANARLRGTRIEFYGSGGRVELGRDVRLFDCIITLRGTAPRLVIGAETRLRGVRIVVEDRGSRLLIGPATSMTGAVLQAKEGGLVEIGTDCMLGSGVEVNNSDSHSLTDATSGERLNPARDVVLGDHVWLGAGVWVSKGARIGAGTVVAARSRVVGELPPGVLAAGSPAIVKRTGINWDRRRLGAES